MPLPPIPAGAVWVPHALLDEVTPPGRPSPDAWIIARPDGSWWLSSDLHDDDTHATPLAAGQIVEFSALVDLPGVELKIGPRIWTTDPPTPPAAPPGFDLIVSDGDHLWDSIDAAANDLTIGRYTLMVYAWSTTPRRFRFTAGFFESLPGDA